MSQTEVTGKCLWLVRATGIVHCLDMSTSKGPPKGTALGVGKCP